MNTDANDYRDVLRHELRSRARANPRYSLRAFARDLGVSPSQLSEVINGKRGLSRASARKLARRLGFGAAQVETFGDLVQSVHARSEREREGARLKLQLRKVDTAYSALTLDAFRAISDWYHLAIVQMTRLRAFDGDPRAIAKSLGITVGEARAAIDRLIRLELLEYRGNELCRVKDYVSAPGGVPSDAIKLFHRQILAKASSALHDQPVAERDFSASLIAIRSEKVEEARARIKRFRRKLSTLLSSDDEPDRVYCLSIQFFDLSEKEK